jgi:hypothetical protein
VHPSNYTEKVENLNVCRPPLFWTLPTPVLTEEREEEKKEVGPFLEEFSLKYET